MRAVVTTIAIFWSLLGTAMVDANQPVVRHYTEIPAQRLETALQWLAKDRDLQVICRTEVVGDLRTHGASGDLTTDQALAQLLMGTGLTYRYLDPKTITIVPQRLTSENQKAPQGSEGAMVQMADEWLEVAQAMQQVAQAGQPKTFGEDADAQKQQGISEIVVTAQKREEKLQDVPISMSVLGGDDLDKSNFPGVMEALRRVPNVSIIESFLGTGSQAPVRGVSAPTQLGAGAGTTAFYLDSMPFGFASFSSGPDPDVYDLGRVEVLRGPQGTLYGASALNGVVRILTNEANPDAFELKARASTSYTENGDANYRGDAAINVPLIDGKLAARAVVGYQGLSGWVDRPNEENADDSERRNMRLKLYAQPTEQLSIGASAWFTRTDYDGLPNVADANGRHPVLFDEPSSTDYDGYGLKIGYEFPAFSLSSATSYSEYTNDTSIDLLPIFLNLGIQTPFSPFAQGRTLSAKTFAQEAYLSSNTAGPWRWSVGAMYRDSEDHNVVFIDALSSVNRTQYSSNSYAIFGELSRFFLGGKLELTAGLRYFEDEVELTELSLVHAKDTFHANTPRVILTWHPSEQLTGYVSYGQGFRSGAHQDPAALQLEPGLQPVKPDTLNNYEVGAKGSVLDGRIRFESALFYIDWRDVQQYFVIPGPTTGTGVTARVNSESASGPGFELSVTTEPVDALEVGLSFGWNDLTIDEDVVTATGLLYAKGDRLAASREYTAGAWTRYEFPMGRSGVNGRLSLSANYMSESLNRFLVGAEQTTLAGDAMVLGNASFSVNFAQWVATAFVDNIKNEGGAYEITPIPSWSVRARPRTIGLQLEYYF